MSSDQPSSQTFWLLLEYWDGTAWVDAVCGAGYERHPGENWLSVEVCHLTEFALLGRAAPVGGYKEALMPLRPELVEGLLLLAAMVFASAAAHRCKQAVLE